MTGAQLAFRRATEADAPATFAVFVAASNDLNRAAGRPQAAGEGAAERGLAFRRHAVAHDGDRFWVAHVGAEVVGFSVAILRENLWYLAALHVLPAYQGTGVGSELIRRSLAGTGPGTVLTVYTDAVNPASNGLYMRFGMLATEAITHFEGPLDESADEPAGPRSELSARPLVLSTDRAALDELDRTALGSARGVDHELWSGLPGARGLLLERDGAPRGYVYATASGHLGPVAVHRPEELGAALDAGAALAREAGATELHVRAPGSCREAARWSLAHGLLLSGIGLMLSSHPVGRMDGYVMSVADALM